MKQWQLIVKKDFASSVCNNKIGHFENTQVNIFWIMQEMEKKQGDKDKLELLPAYQPAITWMILRGWDDFLPSLSCLWPKVCVHPDMSYCACPECIVLSVHIGGLQAKHALSE